MKWIDRGAMGMGVFNIRYLGIMRGVLRGVSGIRFT